MSRQPRFEGFTRRAADERQGSDDSAFTLVEMSVALSIIVVVMASLPVFVIGSLRQVSHQGDREVAVQLSRSAMELARAHKTVLTGRDEASTTNQWEAAPPAVRPFLQAAEPIFDTDPLLQVGAGVRAALPTTVRTVAIGDTSYSQSWYVGRCREIGGSATSTDRSCGTANAVADVPLVLLVVSVTWTDRSCAGNTCSYVASSLISEGADPTFKIDSGA